jgi:hypothetical protein
VDASGAPPVLRSGWSAGGSSHPRRSGSAATSRTRRAGSGARPATPGRPWPSSSRPARRCPGPGVLAPGERRVDRRAHRVPRRPAADRAAPSSSRMRGRSSAPAIADVLDAARTPRRRRHLPLPGRRPAPVRATVDVPEGLLVIGDALCSFDPAFGQGMSTAALGGRRAAGRRSPRVGTDLGRASSTARRSYIDTPWQIVVGGCRRHPGPDPEAAAGTAGRFLPHRAAVRRRRRPEAGRAFLRVAHMTAPPQSLMTPGLAARVFGGCC